MSEYGSNDDIYAIDLTHQVFKNKCACGESKLKYQSFCNVCILEMPKSLRMELWLTFEDGFAEVYDDCLKWMIEHSTRYMGIM